MALLDFGGNPIAVTATGPAPAEQVLDLGLYFSSMTLLLTAYTLQATGGGQSFVLKMETTMDPKATTWIPLGPFATMTTAPDQDKQTFTDLLRYVRWNVTLTNISLAMFSLSGVARNP